VNASLSAVRIGVAVALVATSLVSLTSSDATTKGCDASAKVHGGDWPTMGGNLDQTNYQAAEHAIGPATVGGLKLRWVSGAPVNPGQGTPVVAGNCVFVTGLGPCTHSMPQPAS
jgi:hypothetical protein